MSSAEMGADIALEETRAPSKYPSHNRSFTCSGRAWCLTGAGLSLALLLAAARPTSLPLRERERGPNVVRKFEEFEDGPQPPDAEDGSSSSTEGDSDLVVFDASDCSGDSEDCTSTQCCSVPGTQCYEKNSKWAACFPDCTPGPRPGDIDDDDWSCRPLGSRYEGRTPKLFCWSIMRTTGYEVGLMKVLLEKGVGIFACDGNAVLTQGGQISLGLPKGSSSSTDEFFTTWVAGADGVTVPTSGQGTAVNAELFKFAWRTILNEGHYKEHDWSVKADPDTVLLPGRLQEHLRPHTGRDPEQGGSFYVVNCNRYPSNPNFPMIYGALEVYSTKALQTYSEGEARCDSLPWKAWQWGEDKFMGKCMGLLGVTRLDDFAQVGDKRCTFSGCGDASRAAYHSFKDVASWMSCWGEANAANR